MTSPLELAILFTSGVIIQAIWFIEDRTDVRSFFLCLIFGGVCAILSLTEISLPILLLMGAMAFSAIFAIRLRHRVLPVLTEHSLLYLNITYAYLVLSRLHSDDTNNLPLIALGLFPSILTLILAFYPRPLTRLMHTLAFGWFIVMNTLLFFGQFIPLLRQILINPSWTQILHPIEMVAYGSTFFLLISYFTYLYILVPLPDRHLSRRIRDLKEFIWFLNAKYNSKQLRVWESALILVVQGGLLWGNHRLRPLPDAFVINLTILGFGLFARRTKPTKLRPIHHDEA